jgi:hypothetical protein
MRYLNKNLLYERRPYKQIFHIINLTAGTIRRFFYSI